MNKIMELFSLNASRREQTKEVRVKSYGHDVTFNIMPMSFIDSTSLVLAAGEGGRNEKIPSIAKSVLDIVARYTVEFASIKAFELTDRGLDSVEAFVEKTLCDTAISSLFFEIRLLTSEVLVANETKAFAVADLATD